MTRTLQPLASVSAESTELLDATDYAMRSEAVKAHLDQLLDYLREREGKANLADLLEEFRPTVAITPEQVGVVITQGVSDRKLETYGLECTVRLL